MIKAVLFDLDGTLADTALDLTEALNRLLDAYTYPRQSINATRAIASHGSRALIQLGFGISDDDPRLPGLQQQFFSYYARVHTEQTCLFDGIIPLITALSDRDLIWGIVTNKPSQFTDSLVAALPFPTPPAVVVSADTVGFCKPDPRPMQYALASIKCRGPQAIYLGDAQRDIEAGRAVGMKTGIAEYGYLAETDQPEQWGAHFTIAAPLALLDHL